MVIVGQNGCKIIPTRTLWSKKMSSTRYHHLLNNVPNNFLTRWLVDYTNQRMRKSQSLFRLQRRYRRPKEGYAYDTFGSIVPRDYYKNRQDYIDGIRELPPVYKRAKKFSLYLRNR